MKTSIWIVLTVLIALSTACTDEKVAVIGISLSDNGKIITEGETYQLTATVSPSNASNKNVIWSSASETVATVNQSGLVTAVSTGTVAITATTEDGGFKAECYFLVSSKDTPGPGPEPEPTGIKLKYFTSDKGFIGSKETDGNVSWTGILGSKQPILFVFFLTENGTDPINDAEASHYSMSEVEGEESLSNSGIYFDPLSGVSTGQFVFRFYETGSAKYTLSYDNNAGLTFSQTVTLTATGTAHEYVFQSGMGKNFTSAYQPYDKPVEVEITSGDKTVVIAARDMSLGEFPRAGTYSIDRSKDDPLSTAEYSAAVDVDALGYPGVRVNISKPGYVGIWVRYDNGDLGSAEQQMTLYVPMTLGLSTSASGTPPFISDKLDLNIGLSKSLFFFSSEHGKVVSIVKEDLALSEGDSSIVAISLSADQKSLVFTPIKAGTTSWKITYSHLGTTLERTVSCTVAK